jgi:BlaR1 peptidase M56
MASARRLYRVVVALAAVALAAVAAGLVVAGDKAAVGLPSAHALTDACRELLPSGSSLLGLPIMALAAVGIAVAVRAARAAWRQLRAERHFRDSLRPCGRLDAAGMPITVVNDREPRAFCAGYLRPRINLSTGALARLSEGELEAVVAHERHHLERRDPLRLLVAGVLADALFFLPALRRLADRYAALAELAADEAATRAARASTLASAMLVFSRSPSPELVVGLAPERVDQLLGERPRWELPASLFLGALVTLAGLLAAIVSVLSLAGATRVDLAVFLAQSCMLLLCVAGVAAAAAGLFLRRRRADRRYAC